MLSRIRWFIQNPMVQNKNRVTVSHSTRCQYNAKITTTKTVQINDKKLSYKNYLKIYIVKNV